MFWTFSIDPSYTQSFGLIIMLNLPSELLTCGVFVHLSIRDLQAVNVAFTSTHSHRARIKELWKSYPYECPYQMGVTLDDVKWLKSVNVKPVSVLISETSRDNAAKCVEFIVSNFTNFREFKCDVFNISEVNLVKLAQGCPLLSVLSISCTNATDAGILALVQNCRQLHTLEIQDCVPLRDSAITLVCSNCPFLKHISLFNGHNLTDATLTAIANSYPHLESIRLYSYNFTNDGLLYIADKCHELRSVNIKCDNITSRGLTALWAANPNLMDVDISFNRFISDDDVIQLAQCCPLLQKLNISDCYRITDAAVIAVAEHCPQLRSLNISNCYVSAVSDASLIALGQHCNELKSIDISYIKNISDEGIAALAAGCPLLQEFCASDTNITDAGVVELARGCRDLRKINLTGCSLIGIDAVTAIAENCHLISQLCLSWIERINDACLYVVAQHCRNLICFSVSRHGVSSESVEAVYRCCRNLRCFT